MTPPKIAILFFAQGFVSNNPAARLTVCPQPAWNYDFSSDPSVPELAQLGEAIKYFKPISIQIVDKIYRRHIGHYRPEAALEAMEGVKGFETALQRYVHARLNCIVLIDCVCVYTPDICHNHHNRWLCKKFQ